jgi:hypothetical protein
MDAADSEKLAEQPIVNNGLDDKRSSLIFNDDAAEKNIEGTVQGVVVNASGHQDELKRHFSIWSLIGLALTIDNAWVALGGSLGIAICKCNDSTLLYMSDPYQIMVALLAFFTN